jgi:SAM-dependent methyltransferase
MLDEHLSQEHDLASRRVDRIDAHVAWLNGLADRPGRVLDLACGPGLYAARLAALGHRCVGIDFSPAAIEYARSEARRVDLDCEYRLADVTEPLGESGVDLALVLYGELDTMPPEQAATVLERVVDALVSGGRAVLEVHTRDAVRHLGEAAPVWSALARSLFSDRPHLLLEEAAWDGSSHAAVRRFWVVDDGVTMHSVTTQARDYAAILRSRGLPVEVTAHPRGVEPWVDRLFQVLIARRV